MRWLLADEVGLGKTIEAALILNRLLHTQQIERCLVVAPESLTIQWLGELWRKYHQVFTLLDAARLADVARDFGEGFNPFDVHRRAVVALEMLIERPELTEQAVSAGIDLLVVDEAQRLRRPPGHPGEPAYRAVARSPRSGGTSCSSARRRSKTTRMGSSGCCSCCGRTSSLRSSTSRRGSAPARRCRRAPARRGASTSAVCRLARRSQSTFRRRGGSPRARHDARRSGAARRRRRPVSRRRRLDRIRRALASGAALEPCSVPTRSNYGSRPRRWTQRSAARLAATQAARWREANEKTLVFVAHRETLEMLRDALSARAQVATGVFHEDLSAARRDIEVARFRAADGPSLMISTESGGEGRNFEFCHRLVLYDLPWKPATVEQRIGRLDRIGRRTSVAIVYFRPASGIGADVVRLFERLAIFREPIAGLEPQLAHLEGALERIALDPEPSLTDEQVERLVAAAQEARTRIHEAAYQQLHRDPYRPELGPAILAAIPPELDALMEQVVINACARLGFRVEAVRGMRTYAIDFGNEALVDSLPGVPGGASFIGSFDREYAVEDETIDFFASGHALVEGLLAHFEEDPKGRVARVELHHPGQTGTGLVAFYKDGAHVGIVALDVDGRERPDWAAAFRRRPPRVSRMEPDDAAMPTWPAVVRRLGAKLGSRRPHALAAIVVRDA